MENSKKIVNERESNMELLRIVSILFVTIHHFLTHGAFPAIFEEYLPITTADSIALMLNGFVFIGVNCFILISGYFGIKFKAKGLIQLLAICLFYSVLGYFIHLWVNNQPIGKDFMTSVLFFKHSNWWFVKCYIGLWLMAPILNKAVEGFNKREYQVVLVLMTIASVYFGNLRRVEFFDMKGFSIMHFAYMYMIGGYIKHHIDTNVLTRHRNYIWMVYVLCALLWGGLSIADHFYSIKYWHISTYNNIVLLFASVAFFCAFTTIKIQSKVINDIAKSAFPVYLMQEHSLLHIPLYESVGRISAYFAPPPSSLGIGVILVIAVIFFVIVCAFDQLRVMLLGVCNRLYYQKNHA